MAVRCLASEPVPMPNNNETKAYPQKIVDIVDQIGQLNLMEVSDLNELLKVFDPLTFIRVSLRFTVWKFQGFSITQILREINFENF